MSNNHHNNNMMDDDIGAAVGASLVKSVPVPVPVPVPLSETLEQQKKQRLEQKYAMWKRVYESRRKTRAIGSKKVTKTLVDGKLVKQRGAVAPAQVAVPSVIMSEITRKINALPTDHRGAWVLVQVKRILQAGLRQLTRSETQQVFELLNDRYSLPVQQASLRSVIKSLNFKCRDERRPDATAAVAAAAAIQHQSPQQQQRIVTTLTAEEAATIRAAAASAGVDIAIGGDDGGGGGNNLIAYNAAADTTTTMMTAVAAEMPPSLAKGAEQFDEMRLSKKEWNSVNQQQQQPQNNQQRHHQHHNVASRQRHKVNAGREFRQKAEQ